MNNTFIYEGDYWPGREAVCCVLACPPIRHSSTSPTSATPCDRHPSSSSRTPLPISNSHLAPRILLLLLSLLFPLPLPLASATPLSLLRPYLLHWHVALTYFLPSLSPTSYPPCPRFRLLLSRSLTLARILHDRAPHLPTTHP